MPKHIPLSPPWTSPGAPAPGSHIAFPGNYCNSIERLTNKYPNLKYPDYKKYHASSEVVHNTRTAIITFKVDAKPEVASFSTLDQLRVYLQPQAAPPEKTITRELFLVEGTNPEVVDVLGSALQVDPNVFMRHSRTGLWESDHRAGCTAPLPSLMDPAKGFVLSYRELLFSPGSIDDYPLRSANNERNIRVTSIGGKFEKVGAVHRKASFWAKEMGEGSWKAVIVLDEPVEDILIGKQEKFRRKQYPHQPFQGGYADFIAYTDIQQALESRGPPRTSMYDDLCYYFSTHPEELDVTERPDSVTFFLKKIIASHYMMLYTYTQGILDHLTWFLGNQQHYANVDVNTWVADLWSDLHTFNRRCQYDMGDISSIIDQLDLGPDSPPYDSTAKDFLILRRNFQNLNAKSEAVFASCNALANVWGINQSLFEARVVKQLTIFGVVFLPLSFTASLFSMSGDYLPGGPKFWTYWVVAIPIILAISAYFFMGRVQAFQEKLNQHHLKARVDIWGVGSRYGSQNPLQMDYETQFPQHEKF